MLSAFPDYGKSAPEYLLSVTELLASYPPDVQVKLADHRTGIPAKTQFLPTVAVIVEMADNLMAQQAKLDRYSAIRQRPVEQIEYKGAYIPFPRLWEAFADELDLLRGREFSKLSGADKMLAIEGKAAARAVLTAA